jgi:hypothetical protein
MIYAVAFNAVLLACCGFAGWFGGRDERIGAALMFAASISTTALVVALGSYGGNSVLAIDLAMLAALTALALRSDRYWPLAAAGFHCVGVATHAALRADTAIESLAYAHALGLWSYLTLCALAAGTWEAMRQKSTRSWPT